MSWLWILLIVLVLVVITPFVIGMLLPNEYEGELNLTFESSPDEVWRTIADFDRHPVSGAMRRSTAALEDAELPSWLEDLGSTQVLVTTEESDEPRRVVRRMEDQVIPMSSRWTIEIDPTEEGSLVRAVNRTTIRSGSWHSPVFRLIMKTSGGAEKVLREFFRSVAGDLGVTAHVVAPDYQRSETS